MDWLWMRFIQIWNRPQREDVLRRFTSKRLPVLVATDILSRGIDIDHIDLVINFDVPNDGEDYVHRIGRTARAEMDGTAYTFVSPKEQNKMGEIESFLGMPVPKAQVPNHWERLLNTSPRSAKTLEER